MLTVGLRFYSRSAWMYLKNLLKKVGLPYHSPHKFKHGHAVYASKNAKDVSALKAVSQNLMHENLSITDGVYGILSEFDVRKQIDLLVKPTSAFERREAVSLVELIKDLQVLLKRIENAE